jgi:enamine deaminase RidA (YjgF/YER057c/UK114 family)
MSHLFLNPDGIATPETYSHVVVAQGTKLVFVSGQVAENSQGELVGPGDMLLQARQAFENLGHALAAGGARPDQVTKLTIFVANFRREHLAMIEQGRAALFGTSKPADTLVGVATLTRSEYLIEVDAMAVIE